MSTYHELKVSLNGPRDESKYARLVLTEEFFQAIQDKQPDALKGLEWQISLMVKSLFNDEGENDPT